MQLFLHQCVMPVPSLVYVATLSSNTLFEALSNPAPAASFATIGDDTLRALTNLSRLFTTAIPPTVAPVPAATFPTLLVAPSLRVLASPSLSPVATSPALSPRVVPVSTPPIPHLVAPENNDPVPRRYYPLRSESLFVLSERGLH